MLTHILMIRSFRPTDLISILAAGNSLSNYVRTGDCLGPDNGPRSLIPSLVGHFNYIAKHHWSWVWIEKNKIQGLISIRQRGGRSTWEINSLLLCADSEKIGFNLLDALGLVSGPLMIARFFLRLPGDSRLTEVVKKSGFSSYARQRVYLSVRREPAAASAGTCAGLFLSRAGEDFKLFQAYNQVTPENIRRVEGLTFEEWKESREACPGETVFLCERDGKAVGWLRTRKTGRKGCLEIFTAPDDRDALKDAFSQGLSQVAPQKEVYCLAFSYQTGLCQLLEDQGFRIQREYNLLTREQLVRVKQPYLVPAGL